MPLRRVSTSPALTEPQLCDNNRDLTAEHSTALQSTGTLDASTPQVLTLSATYMSRTGGRYEDGPPPTATRLQRAASFVRAEQPDLFAINLPAIPATDVDR